MKWALVFATISDLKKDPDTVSPYMCGALGLTGLIWSRYATQITPVNYNLLTVNMFVFLTNAYQIYRFYEYVIFNI